MSERDWFFIPKPADQARIRLFCFPHAGGNGFFFRGWPKYFPSDVEIIGIQTPGRAARFREAPFRRIEDLVGRIADVMQPLLTCHYAIYGHSFGALCAFETARFLRRKGTVAPLCLMLSGREGPQIPDKRPPLHRLPKLAFLETLLQRYPDGTPTEILLNGDFMDLLEPSIRADFEMLETWTYQEEAPLASPLFIFGGRADANVPGDALGAWASQTVGACFVELLPGGHFFMQKEEFTFLSSLARALRSVCPLPTDRAGRIQPNEV
jgi:medium-chain acyl-[acyl-carrier-protein] hydrolase